MKGRAVILKEVRQVVLVVHSCWWPRRSGY